ncbi:MAG: class II glutamine amidotransferase [Flavobacteriales bacterium]|jgi:amidophosphoribosyltransferase|nr:class II glutamine amidotransferase [Flavobacteriales bacterium]
MTESLHHECGIAMLRLLKPMEYYIEKYQNPFWALQKMSMLMQKQVNRGQDGAGIANIKFDLPPGYRYISRKRAVGNESVKQIMTHINTRLQEIIDANPEYANDAEWLKKHAPFTGELFLAHLRYGTYGGNNIEHCHPFLRQNNWKSRNLVLAGNFNMTNVDEQFQALVDLGQHPKEKADTITILEKIGHFLDEEVDDLYYNMRDQYDSKKEMSKVIERSVRVDEILKKSSKRWDGGYVISGLLGHGDAFIMRDPNGIRPAFYYQDEEIFVAASERSVIQTAFNVPFEEINQVARGSAIIVKRNGEVSHEQILEQKDHLSCSFERIYFSRGNDAEIYKERKKLGELVTKQILDCVNDDIRNTVFTYIPNTAETCFYGMVKEVESRLKSKQIKEISALGNSATPELITNIIETTTRIEKIAIKDAKLRTFITNDNNRDDLVGQVYDITYGEVKPTDNLVVIDDSIVRGTTLKQSVLKILDRLNAKHIVVVSSAPQIRYPDCYGIDMAKLGDFVAFKAAIALLKERGMTYVLDSVYEKCKKQANLPDDQIQNFVKEVYEPFDYQEISDKVTELLVPNGMKSRVDIIFQSVEALHEACPNDKGDWYFTGNYPTPGGMRVVNQALINYVEGKNVRAY